jgi:hypothetical protein
MHRLEKVPLCGISKPGWHLLLIEASTTDLLSERADTPLYLAHVLAAAGQVPDACAATQALYLYQTHEIPARSP